MTVDVLKGNDLLKYYGILPQRGEGEREKGQGARGNKQISPNGLKFHTPEFALYLESQT